ncbi:nuclear transport factor 2 family protein [Marinovum sp. 2_MG-2023]|uniref:nuclear transport factor 2 family protein n=1 Tax=unclassified Marinovum TaxID=2647166 RepID=UPI0026E357C0|nr:MULTISPECIES: nuclear transport factor 2 family protein [unclassified Marinovum]MDO6732363.1 nuclear transport factor 2 family protein [Marinovum sp. 2_MG-2023]MDO6781680.1 nuclear transport factor 2 family protein [Marinovum sp. 1_MG-2023]
MPEQTQTDVQVRQAVDELIETATSYDVDALERIYHDDLHVIMIDHEHNLNTANKEAFKGLFASKRAANDPPMNTWAKYHSIDVSGDTAHVLLSRKNDLNGTDMDLTLSIDLVFQDNRWQVKREVIFLRPEAA